MTSKRAATKRSRAGKPPGKPTTTDKAFIAALRKHAGIPALAAKELKLTRQAVDFRMKHGSKRVRDAVAEIDAELLDLGKGNIVKSLMAGDGRMTRWFMEQKGAALGFGRRIQVEGRLADGDLEALVAAFGGDVARLRAIRAAVAARAEG